MIKLNQLRYKEEYTYYLLLAIKEENKDQFRTDFLELHPADQTQIFMALDDSKRTRVYSFLTPSEFGDIFSELPPLQQKNCLLELDHEYAILMLNDLPSDDAADFIGLLPNQEADYLLNQMDQEEADDIKQLLTYFSGTAGSLLTTEFISVRATDSVAAILQNLRLVASHAETIYYLYVTDATGKLFGVLSLRDLIVSNPDSLVQEIMATQIISVKADSDLSEVGHLMKKYGLPAIPVLRFDDIMIGIVTFDDILTTIMLV
ncbi:magnesium transporter [Paenibacillus alba]|uniref:magnesium transporter n=1 Tax=Paenibacillus alba TaxID=1197127 RepID=UPI001566A5BD|nr:CBS domain-containing protein [Paenibacillus alba]NQX70865.1 magnesium transporter [Paenibacillus alba]